MTLTFDDIALLRKTLCAHFGLVLEMDRRTRLGHMVPPGSPCVGRSQRDTDEAAELYNKLADLHAQVDA